MLNPGQVVDRYVVESLIGTGGTAVVYRVRHKTLGTEHALKVLSVTSPSIRERMMQEGQVQAALRHLNVVAVTDVLDVDGDPGLLMEYIEGPPLDEALHQYRLDLHSAEVLFLGIVSGVRHAHRAGLVHRDLKPANVLLASTPEGFVPKVTDFGLAKVLQSESSANVGHTRAGVAMGTPAYMSPEQVRDASNVDQRADLFSLGCLFYELITRHRAFPGEQALAVYNAVTDGAYRPPRELVPELPDRIDQAIRGCLVIEREHRIPDCDTLLEVLRGERTWHPPEVPTVDLPEPELREPEIPTGPGLEVAARGPKGATPAPAPPRGPLPPPTVTDDGEVFMDVAPTEETSLPVQDDPSVEAPEEEDETSSPSPLRWLLLGFAVVVLLGLLAAAGVGTLVWALLGPWEVEPSQPPPPPVVVEPIPQPEEPVPEEPEDAPEPEDEPTEDQASTAPSSPDTPETQPAPTPQPVRAAPITVKILSVPPTATVRVDGEEIGRTPLKVDLRPGRHSVVLELGHQQGTFDLTPRAGAANRWCHTFGEDAQTYEGMCPR